MKDIIARNFGLLRSKLGISQLEMANYLGLGSREIISYYENAEREIPLPVLESCCNLFGIELFDLFEEDEKLVGTNIHFAFRADQLDTKDMNAISDFKKIINNYQRMKRIANE